VPAAEADELGALAVQFNTMASALEAAERRRVALIGDVAHELRTPLATIEGYTEGLLDGVVSPSAENWALLHDEAGRLRRLVQELQELSRAEARQLPLQLRPCPPAELVEQTVRRIAPQFAEKGVTLSADVPADLPAVQVDADRIIQVLINLLGNALRSTPAEGKVQVRVERQQDAVTFHVVDSGIGIAPEHLPHLFERFYRVDKARSRALGGSGIGLTIAKAIVEAHDGQIWAASPGLGQGATFSFTLPIADSASS
jgi:signal transduction histidine kinase